MNTEYTIGGVRHVACGECLPDKGWIALSAYAAPKPSLDRCEFCGYDPGYSETEYYIHETHAGREPL